MLERVDMPLGEVIYESGVALNYVYFPDHRHRLLAIRHGEWRLRGDCRRRERGHRRRIDFHGRRIHAEPGGRAERGIGCRLKAALMKTEFDKAGAVLHLLLRYTQALITQMAQTAVCNRHHSLDQQLCRWLLLSLDRLEGPELVMTQELIANMLGVRREGVTEGALKLQKAGLIQYSRGVSRSSIARVWNFAPASATRSSSANTTDCCRPSSRNSDQLRKSWASERVAADSSSTIAMTPDRTVPATRRQQPSICFRSNDIPTALPFA